MTKTMKTGISDIHGEEDFGSMEMNVDTEKMKELVDDQVFASTEKFGHECPKCQSDDFIVMFGFKFLRTKDEVTEYKDDKKFTDSPIIICNKCGKVIDSVV